MLCILLNLLVLTATWFFLFFFLKFPNYPNLLFRIYLLLSSGIEDLTALYSSVSRPFYVHELKQIFLPNFMLGIYAFTDMLLLVRVRFLSNEFTDRLLVVFFAAFFFLNVHIVSAFIIFFLYDFLCTCVMKWHTGYIIPFFPILCLPAFLFC